MTQRELDQEVRQGHAHKYAVAMLDQGIKEIVVEVGYPKSKSITIRLDMLVRWLEVPINQVMMHQDGGDWVTQSDYDTQQAFLVKLSNNGTAKGWLSWMVLEWHDGDPMYDLRDAYLEAMITMLKRRAI